MNTKKMATVAMIAAIYVGLTVVLAPISYGPIQVRISEMLTLLPIFYSPSIIGVTLGCFLANLVGVFMGSNVLGVYDIFIGTIATLIAAIITYKTRDVRIKNYPWLAIASPIVFNGIIIGAELAYAFMPDTFMVGWLINGVQVAIGEAIAVIVLYPLVKVIVKRLNLSE